MDPLSLLCNAASHAATVDARTATGEGEAESDRQQDAVLSYTPPEANNTENNNHPPAVDPPAPDPPNGYPASHQDDPDPHDPAIPRFALEWSNTSSTNQAPEHDPAADADAFQQPAFGRLSVKMEPPNEDSIAIPPSAEAFTAGDESSNQAPPPPQFFKDGRPRMRTKKRMTSRNFCGSCENCMVDDCGECVMCLDKPRFGGEARKKQNCTNRPPCLVKTQKLPAKKRQASPGTAQGMPKRTRTRKLKPPPSTLASTRKRRETPRQSYAFDAFDDDDDGVSAAVARKKPPRRSVVHGTLPLSPLSPPPPVPNKFPCTGACKWSFDETTRVLLAQFDPQQDIHAADIRFLLHSMERNDVTVVSEGLADKLDGTKWTMDYVADAAGDEYYHKFRRFQSTLVENLDGKDQVEAGPLNVVHKEMDGMLSMKVRDYIRYLHRREAALDRIQTERRAAGKDLYAYKDRDDYEIGREKKQLESVITSDQTQDSNAIASADSAVSREEFRFVNHKGVEVCCNLVDDVIYMIDFDLPKLLPSLHEDFVKNFRLTGCLPGGDHCMMQSVNAGGRPFMGPNFYVTPPASFTHFHQDGHGTVDSGHLCLSGYNEVIMLCRMPEEHKHRALYLLNGEKSCVDANGCAYDGLYGLPHGDSLGEKPMWPTSDAIQKCREMNYCPSVFTLKPGQLVHINKGRLHAFRKMSLTPLPKHDCHYTLRSQTISSHDWTATEPICVSVAWDWMFKGVTKEGINEELTSTLQCAKLNREHNLQSLAIPETSILQMARRFLAESEREKPAELAEKVTVLQFGSFNSPSSRVSVASSQGLPSSLDVLAGLLPSLKYMVSQHETALNATKNTEPSVSEELGSVSIADRPDAWEDPQLFSLDPYGNGDFVCKVCSEELSNCYMHCDGCEKLLNKDFNICLSCHSEQNYAQFVQMHPLNDSRHSTINHTGNMRHSRQSRCPCKKGPVCKNCTFCAGCSCRCHKRFSLRLRFMPIEDEVSLLDRVCEAVEESISPSCNFDHVVQTNSRHGMPDIAQRTELSPDIAQRTELSPDIAQRTELSPQKSASVSAMRKQTENPASKDERAVGHLDSTQRTEDPQAPKEVQAVHAPVTGDLQKYIGARVAKYFNNRELFYGVVRHVFGDRNGILWRVRFDDGDVEDFNDIELIECINLAKANPESAKLESTELPGQSSGGSAAKRQSSGGSAAKRQSSGGSAAKRQTKSGSKTTDRSPAWEGPPDDDLDGAIWPVGWWKKVYLRPGSKHKDRYWFTPQQKYKLRSLVAAKRFLKACENCNGDEELAKQYMKAKDIQA